MEPLSPPSEEIRLRDEESDTGGERNDQVKRIKPKGSKITVQGITKIVPVTVKESENSLTRKVPMSAKVPISSEAPSRGNPRKVMNYGQEILSPSIMESGFSSCEFHSIDEFSLDKSNIEIRHMNFDSNAQKPKTYGGQPNFEKRDQQPVFDYSNNFGGTRRTRDRALRKRENSRKILNVEPQVKESKISYVIRDASSYEK